MTFLNPFLLFGLAAATIPIIIHLLNLRKLKTIEFSTLQFLKELQKTKMRRVKIRQWLLLALRTLMIISIVMAFSRPALRGSLASFGGVTSAKTTLVILIDDSPSMNVRNERGSLIVQAKGAALKILQLMKDGDEAYLIKLSEVLRTPTFTPAHTAAQLESAVEELTASHVTVSFREAFGVAAKLLAESKNFNKEIYLITDAQATQVEPEKTDLDTTDLFDDMVKVFVTDVRSESKTQYENAGIPSAEITSRIITQNKPLTIQATVRNTGPTPLRNSVLSVYLDGTRVLQHSLDIPSGSLITPALTIIPKRRGIIEGYLQIEDDVFEADNRRYFVLNVPNSIRVLSVGPSQHETQLASLALTLDTDSSIAGLFSVQQILEPQFSFHDLNKYDLLMLCGVKDFSGSEADRITQFVSSGGGVMIFAGKDMDIDNYNDMLFSKMGLPRIGPQRTLSNPDADQSVTGFLSFGKVDFSHPLFAGLFEEPSKHKSQPSIESPKVYRTILPQPGTNGRSVISLSDGTNFLTDYQYGEGRILLYSVEAALSWSDFPLKGLFVPLLYRSGLYLSQTGVPVPFTAGDEINVNVRMKDRSGKDAFILRSPSGIDERIVLQLSSTGGAATFVSTSSSETGIYQLRKLSGSQESQLLHSIPVNVASTESDLSHVTDGQMTEFFGRLGLTPEQIRRVSSQESIDTEVLQSRFGVELWKYFVGLTLLLAFFEMAIGREAKEENLNV